MKALKPNQIAALIESSRRLPDDIIDFQRSYEPHTAERRSRRAKQLVQFFKPLLESVSWDGPEGMSPVQAKRYKDSAQTAAAFALATHLKSSGMAGLRTEASTAGVDLPTFTRQLLMVITRAYAQLFAMQLFGFMPISQPTGRIVFRDYQYDDSWIGSTPTIAAGDRTDIIAEFNTDFYQVDEGARANKVKSHLSFLDVSDKSYRIATDWTDQMADDMRSVWDEDIDSLMMDHMVQEMTRVWDRLMINAMKAAVPSANTTTWKQTPVGTNGQPNYGTLTPSEQKAWDERLWSDGIQKVISQIRVTRKYNADGDPDFMVVGTDFALALNKLTFFLPVEKNMNEQDLQRGALRDLGVLKSAGIRVLVDPMLSADVADSAVTPTSVAYFGRKPRARGDVGLWLLPYVAIQPTLQHYDTDTGLMTKAVRSRLAIAQPNTGTQPNSSQLGEVYGKLVMI